VSSVVQKVRDRAQFHVLYRKRDHIVEEEEEEPLAYFILDGRFFFIFRDKS